MNAKEKNDKGKGYGQWNTNSHQQHSGKQDAKPMKTCRRKHVLFATNLGSWHVIVEMQTGNAITGNVSNSQCRRSCGQTEPWPQHTGRQWGRNAATQWRNHNHLVQSAQCTATAFYVQNDIGVHVCGQFHVRAAQCILIALIVIVMFQPNLRQLICLCMTYIHQHVCRL